MTRRQPPWWAELIVAGFSAYMTWVSMNPGHEALGPGFWYKTHLLALKARRYAIRLEAYAHSKYLESVMH